MKISFIVLSFLLCISTYGQDLTVTVINVGQGDAIYIECPDGKHQMLIDAGEQSHPTYGYKNSGNEFQSFMEYNHRKDDIIEVVISSHNHSDHIGSMDWVLKTYGVGLYVDNGKASFPDSGGDSTSVFERTSEQISKKSIPFKRLTEEVPDINFCPDHPIKCMILKPSGIFQQESSTNINNYSVIVRIDYKESSFLFTGDAEEELEELLLHDSETEKHLDVDFLKVGHHGSSSSCTKEFLAEVTPNISAISCGVSTVKKNTSHKHPRKSTVDKLLPYMNERKGVPAKVDIYDKEGEKWTSYTIFKTIYFTHAEGDLIFVSDGKNIIKQ